jgi:hypothetical protein
MRHLIESNINGKKVLLMLILTNAIYVIMLTVTIPQVMNFAGGMKILDMMPTGYSPDYANTLLRSLGTEGRHAYLYNQLPLDAIYPFMCGMCYCLLLAYVLSKLNKFEGHLFYLCLIPLFSGLFDYCENIGIVTMLITYPNNSAGLTRVTSIFSVLKSSFTTGYFTILIVGLVALGRRKILQKQTST